MAFHLELDDVHRASHTHPGISVIPAALAICEERKLTPKDFLAAVVVGYDVVTRVGMAVSPSIYVDRVFLAPGTLAPLGAAAAVANLLRLNEDQTAKLFGAAAFLSPLALFEAFAKGAPVKNTAMGWGNLIGIWGAKLCAAGLFGPATAIDGNFGYAKATADTYDLRKIEDPANVNRGILNTGIKPYSCCRQHHSAVDAILELREKNGLRPEQVESIGHFVINLFLCLQLFMRFFEPVCAKFFEESAPGDAVRRNARGYNHLRWLVEDESRRRSG